MLGYGIAKGASQVPVEHQRRKEASARREQAELELKEYKAAAPLRQSEQDLKLAQNQLATNQANSQLLQRETYDAIQRFDVDGDTRHLNRFLDVAKKNPKGGMYKDMVRLDKLSGGPRTSEIDTLLRQAGLNPEEVYNDPDAQDVLLLGTKPNGKYQLVNMLRFKAIN